RTSVPFGRVGISCASDAVAEPQPLEMLAEALRDTLRWLRKHHVRGTVIEGIAASLLGKPRFTRDVDVLVVVEDSEWGELIADAADFGLVDRISNVLDFARESRVLLLEHDRTDVPVDVTLGVLDFEREVIQRRKTVKLGQLLVPVPSPEDLVILKAVAQREEDLLDIKRVLQAQPKLNLGRIREKVGEFAALLEQPEIVDQLEKLLELRAKDWKR